MTMLDRMRRHKGWLKWSLAWWCSRSSCFYIPDFLSRAEPGRRRQAGRRPSPASSGRVITVADFPRVYNTQMQAYRNAYGGNMNDQLLKQLGLDRQILQQLIDEQAVVAEADAPGHHGQRRRGARAHPGHPGLPGERAVRRRGALPADPARCSARR